ncbi:P-type ATPase (P-ATPase) Superfamily [Thraustotheca clavata]|uniref:Calcium-transporting ATPase n=1 Tax=Thraustotheca clavata TaxID=74557 RepID=A0A1V9ZZL1_9STRA|nr:P-type ATPase (P-ATPase) Superfamily [Thraustotheca clavata]
MIHTIGGGGFTLTTKDLIKLIETPKEHVEEQLKALGGTEGVAAALKSSLTNGLDNNSAQDLQLRETTFGRNFIEPEKPASILELMWDAFHDSTIIVLTISGLISLVLGIAVPGHGDATEWIEGASILGAVFIVVGVSAVNDYQKEKQFAALNAIKEDEKIKVIRNGSPNEVSKFKLLVGDIVRVDLGDILPADGLVFDESDLKIDESAMTGETDLMKKTRNETPIMFSGTRVMEGVGKMLVMCVGANSQSGIISMLIAGKSDEDKKKAEEQAKSKMKGPKKDGISDDPCKVAPARDDEDEVYETLEESPLQGKLNSLTVLIGKLGTGVAVLVFVAMAVRFSIETFVTGGASWDSSYFSEYLNFFITGITVLVVAIPEGLPLAVTISLAFSVKKMLADNNLVRHLDACETMGSATTICSDKTGTLTTNRMTVMQCWLGGREYSTASQLSEEISDSMKEAFSHSICLNSTAEILPPKVAGQPFEHTGNKTECALLVFCKDLGVDYSQLRKENAIQHMLTFSSKKKRMSVVAKRVGVNARVFCKGATEVVLGLCSKMKRLDGSIAELTAVDKEEIGQKIIEKYAGQGYRTLCLAIRDLDISCDQVKTWSDDEIETDLTCIAIVGIEDPVRPEVPEAIRLCHRAGIVVRMVTGDNIMTARSIATKCGILKSGDNAITMEGSEFRSRVLDAQGKIIQSEFDKIWPMLRVLARSSPKDKYTLVTGLKQTKLMPYGPQVIAVTGDGTNDAPALKKANVGFAMGICGTAVAKDACDIILMDDNFTSIVNAVKWGRNVYDSISKFLQFQLTVNLVAITLAVLGALILEESPLSAVQLLWVNLIMDTFASLALATEKPTAAMLERRPYPRTKPLLSRTMTKHIVCQSIYQLTVLFIFLFKGDVIFDLPPGRKGEVTSTDGRSIHFTMLFNTFVFMQLFNELNCRKIYDEINIFTGLLENNLFILISLIQVACQILIVQFGGVPFSCLPLNATQWGYCLIISVFTLPLGLLFRCIHLPRWMSFVYDDDTTPDEELNKWVRGLKRLKMQFNEMMLFRRVAQERMEEKKVQHQQSQKSQHNS